MHSHNRRDYRLCNVTFGPTDPKVERRAIIEAEDPQIASCSLGAFVSDDLVDSKIADRNFTLFYWVEVPPNHSPEQD
jgi:hypothetical protein